MRISARNTEKCRKKQVKLLIFLIFALVLWIFFGGFFTMSGKSENMKELIESADRLENSVKFQNKKVLKLEKELEQHKQKKIAGLKPWKEPIPVLVFSCNRPVAVREHVEKLIRYRLNKEQFPIIVSHDCDNQNVEKEVKQFEVNVEFLKHPSPNISHMGVPPTHLNYVAYYRIARHYKLALNHVFSIKNYSSVIITEDDLDIAPDFFSYFSNTRYLLDKDPTLWCVTAWNDNGKSNLIDRKASSKLYRTDFFAGLGWMMTSKTWEELEPSWPSGFWDDWMRDPLQRKGRQCIRPEVSRTGMTSYGLKGASRGQFFHKHTSTIEANKEYTDFQQIDLNYLLPQRFEKQLKLDIYGNAIELEIDAAVKFTLQQNWGRSVRVLYHNNIDFIQKADKLHIMHDFKAGVPRTAYDGIVTCFVKGVRIYLVPNRTAVSDYDPTWFVPSSFK